MSLLFVSGCYAENSDEPPEVAKFNCHRAALSKSTASAEKWRKHFNIRVSDLHVLRKFVGQAADKR